MSSPSQIQEPDPDLSSLQQQTPQTENPISNLEEITHQKDPKSPKTLEMSRIQDLEGPYPSLEENQAILDLDEQEDDFSGNVISPSTKTHNRRQVYKRRKPGDLRRQKAIDKKVDNLLKSANFVPFMPGKNLDFDKYEALLKSLGLWDFVGLDFGEEVRADLIGQFIVSYDSAKSCCFVNQLRINMRRRGFVMAFNLPEPKPKNKKGKVVGSAVEEAIDLDAEGDRMSDDCIKFLEDFVWNWMVLRGDDWAVPNEIKDWMGLIRDGYPERVDWGGLFWFMVENEMKQKDQLRKCYYASHLQYYIKSQRKEVFEEEAKKFVANEGIKEEGKLLSEEDNKQAEVEEVKSFEEEGIKAVVNEETDEVKLLSEEDNKEVKVEEIKKDEDFLEEPDKVEQQEDGDLVSERPYGVELVDEVKEGPGGAEFESVKEDTVIEEENVVLDGPNIELALGQQDIVEREKIDDVNMMNAEDCQEKKHDSWCLAGSDHGGKPFLRPCNLGEGRGSDGNEEGKQEVEQLQMNEGEQMEGKQHIQEEEQMEHVEHIQRGEQMDDMEHVEHIQRGEQMEGMEHFEGWEDAEEVDDVDEVEVDDTDEQVEVEDDEDEDGIEHNIPQNYGSPGADGLPGDLLQSFENAQLPINLQGQQIHENSSIELFASNAETHLMMGGPSMYGNGHKRAIDYDQGTSHLSESKRIRTDVGWDQKTSDFGFCMGQAAQLMEKAKIMYEAKEQAFNDINMNQQYLLRELQQRDNYIESLQRSSNEAVQKKDAEIYRLERELGLLAELVNGYREALKENRRSFLEYRQRCQLPEEPIYKDAGPGGLVLSVTELEKQRQQQENEDRLKRLMIEQKFTEAFVAYSNQFEVLLSRVQMIDMNRLTPIENEVKALKELYATKRNALEKEDMLPTESPTKSNTLEKEDMAPTESPTKSYTLEKEYMVPTESPTKSNTLEKEDVVPTGSPTKSNTLEKEETVPTESTLPSA